MASRKRTVLQSGAENALAERPEGDGYTYLPWVDCIVAGVPCQDVSVAGKRAGLKGERTGLFYEFARILQELRPAWFVFENVPGLLSSNQGRDFAEVLRVLMVECGYGVCWRVLDSQFFGVAQRRRRVFIVGRFGKPCPPAVLFEPEGGAGDSPQGRKAGAGIAHAVAGSSVSSGYRYDPNGEDYVCGTLPAIISALDTSPYSDREAEESRLVVATLTSEGDAHSGFRDEQGLVATLKASSGKHGFSIKGDGDESHIVAQPIRTNPYNNSDPGMEARMLVAFTIQQNDGGTHKRKDRPAGGMYVRETDKSLTQGSTDQTLALGAQADPDGVRDFAGLPEGLDSARYRALGNAVTVSVAEWIGRRIVEAAKKGRT